jgi:hypothetical protein
MIALFVDDIAILLQKSQRQDERRRILFRIFHVCSSNCLCWGQWAGLRGLARMAFLAILIRNAVILALAREHSSDIFRKAIATSSNSF